MNTSELYGLILIGGKSSRMGADKSMLSYHGKSQREYLYDLLKKYCSKVFLSCNEVQTHHMDLPFITDAVNYKGPITGIISAFKTAPKVAWIVLACDMPQVDEKTIEKLLSERNPKQLATCFHHQFAEPLCAIWEPASFPSLQKFIASGNHRPRLFLETHDVHYIKAAPEEIQKLININTPEEKLKVNHKSSQK